MKLQGEDNPTQTHKLERFRLTAILLILLHIRTFKTINFSKMKSLLQFTIILLFVNSLTDVKGQPWELVRETENAQRLLEISFSDSLHGWMVGNKPGDNRAYIIQTDDGGETWNEQLSSVSDLLQDVHSVDSNIVFVLGNKSIQKTINGGDEWTELEFDFVNPNPTLLDFDFVDSTAYAVGDNGTFLKSTDGGDTWTELSRLPSYAYYNAVDFTNPDTGIVVGGLSTDHYALRTVDGGETWDSLAIETEFDGSFVDVSFVNDSIVYIVGRSGKVVKSENYGAEWQEMTRITMISGGSLENTSVYFQDADTGWVASVPIVGSQVALINRTNDGGVTWREELFFNQSPTVWIDDIMFTENGTGWACGYQFGLTLNGEIIFKGTGEVNTSIFNPQVLSSKISLFQNYPNPFGSNTEIMLELSEAADIQLKVYATNGQLVNDLFEGMLPSGRHSFNFNASSLPGGVYVSVLRIDGLSLSRKMLLSR